MRRTVTHAERLTEAQWSEVMDAILSRQTDYEQNGPVYGNTGQKLATLYRAIDKLRILRKDRVL